MTTLNLTTTFIPPSDCLTDIYRYNDNQLFGAMASSCYPQGWTNTTTAFYSPGICPYGYTTGCISAKTANTVTETIATCCPTSFICAATDYFVGCRSTILSGAESQLITVVERSNFSAISTIHTEVIGGNVNAYGVQIRFQATDLDHATTTATSTPTSHPSPGSTLPSPSHSTPTTTPSSPQPSTSTPLSAGAKAGIGIGAALAVCIVLALLWLCCAKRRRRSTTPSTPSANYYDSKPFRKPNHAGDEVSEMHGHNLAEAPGDDLLQHREVEGHHLAHRHELEGSRR